jgi:diguanylate cyclase (GGDEF)-like protein
MTGEITPPGESATSAAHSELITELQQKIEEDKLTIAALTREVSMSRALANQKQQEIEDLRQEAYYDNKTGLLNDRGFRLHAEEMLKAKPDSRFLYVRIDLGNFKAINDSWGHPYGDEILARVGENFRNHDIEALTAREGGDELVSLIDLDDVRTTKGEKMTYEQRSRAITDRLHASGDTIREKDDRLASVGFNFAVGTYLMQPGDSLTSADQIADISMYEDKAIQKQRFGSYR